MLDIDQDRIKYEESKYSDYGKRKTKKSLSQLVIYNKAQQGTRRSDGWKSSGDIPAPIPRGCLEV